MVACPGRAYGRPARTLHWATVLAMAAQFTLGYSMEAGRRGRGRGRGRSGESGRGRGRGGEYDVFGDNRLLTAHVVVGMTIFVLAAVRLWWRHRAGLPPWAPQLSARQRTRAHWTERALYALLFVVPLTGLWLVFVCDDVLAFHVAAHIAFFVTLAAHVSLVLSRRLLPRML